MQQFLNDPYFWSAAALGMLVVILVKYARPSINAWLDGEIAKISAELTQAQHLRREAEELLTHYQQREQEAQREAAALLKRAEQEAFYLREAAERDLKEVLARHAQQAKDRIARAEDAAIADIRRAVITLASEAVAHSLAEQAGARTPPIALALEQAIAQLPQQLSKQFLPK
jgi:F-type H+-transporting ATPase subunit b